MLKQIWVMTRKEFKLWLQRPAQWLAIFLTPLLFIAIMGQVFGGGSAPTVAVYAVNEDEGRSGTQVMELLEREKTLDLQTVESRAEADNLLGQGRRMAAIVVPAGFSDALLTDDGAAIEVIVDPALQESAGIVVGQVQAATASLLIDAEVTRGVKTAFATAQDSFGIGDGEVGDTGINIEDVERFLTAALKGVVDSQVQDALDDPLVRVENRSVVNPDEVVRVPTIVESLVPGYTFLFVFFLVGMMAEVVLDERTSGTLRRLLITPTSRAALLLGKIVPYFLAAAFQIVTVIGIASLIFDISLGTSPAAFALMTAAAAAALVGLGIMVAALVRSEGQARSLPALLGIGMAVVSGAIYPAIRFSGLELLTLHHWAIQGFQNVMVRSADLTGVYLEAGVLLGMAALFFAIGIYRFRFT